MCVTDIQLQKCRQIREYLRRAIDQFVKRHTHMGGSLEELFPRIEKPFNNRVDICLFEPGPFALLHGIHNFLDGAFRGNVIDATAGKYSIQIATHETKQRMFESHERRSKTIQ